jgi:Kef-type K+ transport system membrane component KefB
MMARAEVALVTAQKGVEYGIIDTSIMPFIVLLIVITSFVTPIALQSSYKKETPNDLRAGQLKQ